MSRRSVPRIAPNDLRDHADEARIARVWDRLEQDLAGTREAPARRSGLVLSLLAATVAAFAGGLIAGKVVWGERPQASLTAVAPSDHAEFLDVLAAGSESRTVPLPGGGQITLAPESTVEVERTSSGVLTLRLVRGEASVDTAELAVAPEFAIVAGEARLSTAAGSVVRVRRNQDDMDVDVTDGSVRITSPAGSQELGHGEPAISVPIRRDVTAAPTNVTRPRLLPTPRLQPTDTMSPVTVDEVPPVSDWRTRVKAGELTEALGMLRSQPGGIRGAITSARSATELMAISDVARLKGGDPSAAVDALTRVVQDFPSDPNAQVAAWTLGKMYEKMGQPVLAQTYFEKYRSLSPDGVLAEDALCKQIRAEHRASHKDEAVRMGKEYLNKYPNGPCKEDVERIISGEDAPAEEEGPAPAPETPGPDGGGP